MKELLINKFGAQKIRSGISELYQSDIEGSSLGLYPGQWVNLVDNKKNITYLGHIFSLFEDKIFCNVHGQYDQEPQVYIQNKLHLALSYRNRFKGYFPHSRLVYGSSDGLSGLTIDGYANINLVEINSPAYDQYVDLIKEILKEKTGNDSIIHLKKQVRLDAGIPVYEFEEIEIALRVHENDLDLVILKDIVQKNGYYYDHRENRLRARRIIKSLAVTPKNCLDLFSYVGSWGISFLKEGCESVTFVDQANLLENINANLELNNMEGRAKFIRSDVFKYLDENNEVFDLVCSDPPAFAKNKKSKKRAIEGYSKLHLKALKKVRNGGFFIAASCTKYVSLDELQKTVADAAIKLGRNIKMLDLGVQGFDHSFSQFESNSNYIKYLMYIVE